MTDKNKIFLISVLVSVLVSTLLVSIFIKKPSNVGVTVPENISICSGNEPTTQFCNVNDHNLSVANAFDVAGAATLSGLTKVQVSTSSTMYIGAGNGGGASQTGCLVMGNITYGNPVYVTVTSSTIAATTTKPSQCK